MADDKKISELTSLSSVDSNDTFAIVDWSELTTKRITAANLFASPRSIGSSSPNTGRFTSLQLPSGSIITEFSIDGTLGGDSDIAVPSEKAVKTYVDTALGLISASAITDGDSSVVVSDTTAGSSVTVTIDSSIVSTFTSSGLTLSSGATVNEFSIDGTLAGDSDTAVPTEKAVKTYIDAIAAAISTEMIIADDSYVRVVDDGTNTGYVSIVTDGVEVGYFDSLSTTQRIGKASSAGKVEISDTQVVLNVGVDSTDAMIIAGIAADNFIHIDTEVQRFGKSGDAKVELTTGESIEISIGDTKIIMTDDDAAIDPGSGSVNVLELQPELVALQPNGSAQLTADTTGIVLLTGDHVNNISNSSLLDDEYSLSTSRVTKIYIDNHDASTLSSAQSYADIGDSTTFIDAKAYADAGDTSTLSSANSYADAGDSTTFIDAKAYADSGDTSTLSSANAYTDAQLAAFDALVVSHVYTDSTAIAGNVLLVDSTAGNVNIEMIASANAQIVVKKISDDSNTVTVTSSGTIDEQASVTITSQFQSYTFASDATDFFII